MWPEVSRPVCFGLKLSQWLFFFENTNTIIAFHVLRAKWMHLNTKKRIPFGLLSSFCQDCWFVLLFFPLKPNFVERLQLYIFKKPKYYPIIFILIHFCLNYNYFGFKRFESWFIKLDSNNLFWHPKMFSLFVGLRFIQQTKTIWSFKTSKASEYLFLFAVQKVLYWTQRNRISWNPFKFDHDT